MKATLVWMLGLTLLTVAAGSAGAWWVYAQSDELLHAELMRQLKAGAPGCQVQIDRANFDWRGRVRIYGLSITPPGDDQPGLIVPELTITLDREALAESQLILIQKVQVVRPAVRLARLSDGTWNWQAFRWVAARGAPPLEVTLERGTFDVFTGQGATGNPLRLQEISLVAIPAAAQQFAIEVGLRLEPAGPLRARLSWDQTRGLTSLQASAKRFPIDQPMLETALELFPGRRELVVRLREQLDQALLQLRAEPQGQNPNGAAPQLTGFPNDQRDPLDFGVQLLGDIQLGFSAANAEAPAELHKEASLSTESSGLPPVSDLPKSSLPSASDNAENRLAGGVFQLRASILGGELDHPALPWPLFNVRGEVYADQAEITVRELTAQHGRTSVVANYAQRFGESTRMDVKLDEVPLDDTLVSSSPVAMRKLLDLLGLTGTVGATLEASRTADQGWSVSVDSHLTNGTMTHQRFPYPVRSLQGSLQLRGQLLTLEGTGQAGSTPVKLSGWIRDPGMGEGNLFVAVDQLPIDNTLREACPSGLRKTLEALRMQGKTDLRVRFHRKVGNGQKYEPEVVARVRDSQIEYELFPYRINKLQGFVKWVGSAVLLEQLRGEHDGAVLEGSGRYLLQPAPGELKLHVVTRGAAFDRPLELALPEKLQEIWRDISPTGGLDVTTDLTWSPGSPPVVILPELNMKGGTLLLASFPYLWQDVEARSSFRNGVLQVESLSARHDDTLLRCKGMVETDAQERWKVQFTEFLVDDLLPSPAFRRALPVALRELVELLAPDGRVSIRGPWTIRGEGRDSASISTEWNLQLVLAGMSVMAGLQLDDVHGRLALKGTADSKQSEVSGEIDLSSLSVMGYQITQIRGPLDFRNSELVIGSREIAAPTRPLSQQEVLRAEHVTGRAIDGVLTLDAISNYQRGTKYMSRLTMSRGNLEKYAQRYLNGQAGLAGEMNGWMNLRGTGIGAASLQGEGRLVIAPASLYELPVIIQTFNAMSLDPRRRVAFNQADLNFTIDNSRFQFERISLEGSAISMFGRGVVGFDGSLNLDFFSEVSRNRPGIPLLQDLLSFASRGWVGVEVRGRMGNPIARAKPVPELDDALKQFLGQFRTPAPPPPTFVPLRTGQTSADDTDLPQ